MDVTWEDTRKNKIISERDKQADLKEGIFCVWVAAGGRFISGMGKVFPGGGAV